jgi:hypothetical protein
MVREKRQFVDFRTFGRLRPLHTNAAIFAFAGNAIFAAIYYSTQRLLQDADVQRRAEPDPLLGLAADHRGGGGHAAARHHAGQGVRRARVADRPRDRRGLGGFFASTSSDDGQRASATCTSRSGSTSPRSSPSRSCTSSTTSPCRRGWRADEELLGLRRRAGRVHAVVVRPQRGGVLPDHAVPRADVLLPAQGGGAAGVLYRCRSCTSGRWCSSTSGPARTTCTTRRCPSGRRRLGMVFSLMLWMPSRGAA